MTDPEPAPETRAEGETGRPRGRILGALTLLGALDALWALYLWGELVRARGGQTAFCAFGASQCEDLWNAEFASRIHEFTGLPVAGWGLVWGMVALLLPLAALVASSEGRPGERLRAAVRATGLAGALGVVVLLAASAAEGMFCSSCALTYVFTLAYAGIALRGLPGGASLETLEGALKLAAAATVGVYLVLLYPGLQTPGDAQRAGDRALAALATVTTPPATRASLPAPTPPASPAPPVGPALPTVPAPPVLPTPAAPMPTPGPTPTAVPTPPASPAGPGAPPSTPEAPVPPGTAPPALDVDAQLTEMIASLRPEALQLMSNSLHIYATSPVVPLHPPRHLVGSPDAPVRITTFTDVLCSHCARLHGTLEQLRRVLPPGSFSVDSRQYPLDGNCNSHLPIRGPESVRCLGSKARICMDATPAGELFAGALYARHGNLTLETILEAATPYIDRQELELCLTSPGTSLQLAADTDYAWFFEPHGTPLVLVNGRRATSFGPFLYAMVLTRGRADHPAFQALPQAKPDDEMH